MAKEGMSRRTTGTQIAYFGLNLEGMSRQTFYIAAPVRQASESDAPLVGTWDPPKLTSTSYREFEGHLWSISPSKPLLADSNRSVERWISIDEDASQPDAYPERHRSSGIEQMPLERRAAAQQEAERRASLMLVVNGYIHERTHGPIFRSHWSGPGKPAFWFDDLKDPNVCMTHYPIITDVMDYEGAKQRLRACYPGISLAKDRWRGLDLPQQRLSTAVLCAERALWVFVYRTRKMGLGHSRSTIALVQQVRQFLTDRYPFIDMEWGDEGRPDFQHNVYDLEQPASYEALLPLLERLVVEERELPNAPLQAQARLAFLELLAWHNRREAEKSLDMFAL